MLKACRTSLILKFQDVIVLSDYIHIDLHPTQHKFINHSHGVKNVSVNSAALLPRDLKKLVKMLGKISVRNPAGLLAVLTAVSVVSLTFSRRIPGYDLKTVHVCLLPNAYLLKIHAHLPI